jgi:hypothetical protein
MLAMMRASLLGGIVDADPVVVGLVVMVLVIGSIIYVVGRGRHGRKRISGGG